MTSRGETLRLLLRAIELDRLFLAAHPEELFACLWNRGWWHDAPAVEDHLERAPEASEGTTSGGRLLRFLRRRKRAGEPAAAHGKIGGESLSSLLGSWRAAFERREPHRAWLRSLRPPEVGLDSRGPVVFRAGSGSGEISVVFSPAAERLFTLEQRVWVWDSARGTPLRSLPVVARCLAVSPDGRRIATGAFEHVIRVWDPETGEELAELVGHEGPVGSLAFTPDSGTLVSGGACSFNEWGAEVDADPTLRLWDLASGRERRLLRGHARPLRGVLVATSGTQIVSYSADSLRVWDPRGDDARTLLEFREYENDPLAAAVSSDGERIAVACADSTLRILDAESGAELARAREIGARTTALDFALDDSLLVSGHRDGTARVWDPTSGRRVREHVAGEHAICALQVAARAARIRCASTDGGVITLGAGAIGRPRRRNDPAGPIRALVFAPDGLDLLTASDDKRLRLWNASSAIERAQIDLNFTPAGVAFARDGTKFAAVGAYRLVAFDRSGRLLVRVETPFDDGLQHCLTFSPDGEAIVCGSEYAISLHRARDGLVIRRLPLDATAMGRCTALAWGQNRRWLVSGHGFRAGAWSPESLAAGDVLAEHVADYSVRLWDLKNGEVARTLVGHTADVLDVAFSADDRRVVSADERAATRVWDLASGDCLEVLDALTDPAALATRSEGTTPIPYASNRELSIRTPSTTTPLVRLPLAVTRLAAHPSGRLWATCEGRFLSLHVLEPDR